MGFSPLAFVVLLSAAIVIDSAPSYPTSSFEDIIEREAAKFPKEVEKIEGIKNLSEKAFRQFNFLGFLNTLNTLSNLGGGLGNIFNQNNRNTNTNANGVQATTPRLNGRPGLGFIPDVSKGVDTIIQGVSSGNLEQILEGSFVFAPNGVQKIAGTVLDRVFLPTPAPAPVPSGAETSTTKTEVLTSTVREFTTISSAEAQKQLQQIMRQQMQLLELQAALKQQAQRLQNSHQQKQALESDQTITNPLSKEGTRTSGKVI